MEPKTLRPAFSFGAGGHRWRAKGAQECEPFRMLVDLATARGAPLIDSTSSRIGVRMSLTLTAWRRSPLLKEPKMSERLEMLNKARARMIEDRDAHAKVLAAPFDRDKAERARNKFIEIQTLIDALDRAIGGEGASR
jgi:hypothetical protein